MRTLQKSRRDDRGAFTLIELLVVVSIISILIGILLPTLGQALTQTRQIVCGTTQKGLIDGLIAWSLENKDEIPGASTSSAALLRNGADPVVTAGRSPIVPVQATDWMTPALAGEGLPTGRAARFFTLMERYRCVEMKTRTIVWPGGDSGSQEAMDYLDRTGSDLPYATSYLMSLAWQSTSGRGISTTIGEFPNQRLAISTIGEAGNEQARVRLPNGFTPKIYAVGSPAAKGAFADGFRYVTPVNQGLITDVDMTHKAFEPSPHYSTFTESFSFVNSTAYGEDRGGVNKRLSFRHGGGVNAAFFDGHVERLTEKQFRNPTYWYPSGSRFVGGTSHPEAFNFYQAGQTIN